MEFFLHVVYGDTKMSNILGECTSLSDLFYKVYDLWGFSGKPHRQR